MSQQEARELIYFHKTHKHKRSIGDGTDYRAIDLIHIHTQWIRDVFNRISYDCIGEIYKSTDQKVYPEMTALNEWAIGGFQDPHLDTYSNAEIMHNTVEEKPSREWTLILTLNANYEDGKTYFPDQDYIHQPTACEGILFQGLYHHHGVTPVRRCSRHTISMWFTEDHKQILSDARTHNLDLDKITIRNED